MPDWDEIFRREGRVFGQPHSAMPGIAQLLRESGARRVLDLGCGTGRHLVYLASQGFETYGLDASETAISMSGEWLDREGLRAEIRTHRMEEPFPYSDGFFDGLISIQVLHHNMMKDILVTVGEIARVLKPRGLLFVTFPLPRPTPIHPEDDWKLEPVEPGTYIPRAGRESGIPHHYFTPEEIPIVFSPFEIVENFLDDNGRHRCLLGWKRP